MNAEINLILQEVWADSFSAQVLLQLAVIAGSLFLAWSVNGLLRTYIMRYAQENWKISIGGIKRVLFPLTALFFVVIGRLALEHWHHVSLLKLTASLLLAMAVIRLAVYALRYIFSPGGWLHTMETTIAATVWLIWALHLSGLLPQLIQLLEDISFNVGKTPVTLWLLIQGLFTVLLTLIIALWLSRMLENKLMRTLQISINMRVILSKLVRILLSLIAILMALSAVGLDITFLSVFGGALGVGLGFGLQKIASNYVSGFIILMDDSMHMGDVITVDSHYGVVSEMRTRYMVLRKLDNTEVVIPNETLITNAVINHSLTDRRANILMPVQVSYESPLELAMQLMRDVALRYPRVLKEPEPAVQIKGFADNGINLSLAFWIPDPEEGSASLQSAIYLDIWKAFQANSISIPYPQREVRILRGADTDHA